MPEVNLLIVVNTAELITMLVIGIRIIRFIDKIAFRTEMMWKDYEKRITKPKSSFNED